MARKTLKMLAVALVAAFALSSVAEAGAPPKKSVRHRRGVMNPGHLSLEETAQSDRVAQPRQIGLAHQRLQRTRSQASRSTTSAAAAPPATKAPVARRQSTKPH